MQHPSDIFELHSILADAGAHDTGIVLKIETAAAFQNLPDLLLAAMRRPRSAVMVARGDLGVEVGMARLSEVQEEILWVCEAAHMPAIWATQVLESFAKSGLPTRAEVTDAAMGGRSEAVMLNKGPYMDKVLAFLEARPPSLASELARSRRLLRRGLVGAQSRGSPGAASRSAQGLTGFLPRRAVHRRTSWRAWRRTRTRRCICSASWGCRRRTTRRPPPSQRRTRIAPELRGSSQQGR